MDLRKKPERDKFLSREIIFKSRSFSNRLLRRLFKFSAKLNQADNLSSSQKNSLLNKFRELKSIVEINDYIKHQIERDKAETGWDKKIKDKSYGQHLIEQFENFKKDLKHNLEEYLADDTKITEQSKQAFKTYLKQQEKQFDLELYERFLRLFFMLEEYGREYYQEFLEEGELRWQKI